MSLPDYYGRKPVVAASSVRDTLTQHTPASNTLAEVKTAAPGTGLYTVVTAILFSYSGTPTNGTLTVVERNAADDGDGSTLLTHYITSGGPGPLVLPVKAATAGRKLAVRLAAGGSGVSGALSVWTTTEGA